MKKLIVMVVVIVLAAAGISPTEAAAQCGQGMVSRVAGGSIIGGLIGGLAGGNRKSMAIGAGAGALLSVLSPRDCQRGRQMMPQQQRMSPAANQIADANAPVVPAGPSVLIRTVSGANGNALTPILVRALSEKGYSLVDAQTARQYDAPIDFIMDVTVRMMGNQYGGGGGSFSANRFGMSQNGYGNESWYAVSVTMADARTGQIDASRTGTVTVAVQTYSSAYGSSYLFRVNGYGSGYTSTTDPATGAAAIGIQQLFGTR